MEKFTRLTGVAAPLMQPNIDTDAIVPSRFLTRTTKTGKSGFGEILFSDWRFDADGTPKLLQRCERGTPTGLRR